MTSVEVPTLGESITEATLLQWLKQEGEHVAVDEPICELESDKATVDLPAPASGVLHQTKKAGETARVGEVIAQIDPGTGSADVGEPPPAAKAELPQQEPEQRSPASKHGDGRPTGVTKEARKAAPAAPGDKPKQPSPPAEPPPAAKPPEQDESPKQNEPPPVAVKEVVTEPAAATDAEGVRREPMSKIRRRIAERLVRAQQTAAMLTTFNEIDTTAIQELRHRHGQRFAEKHGVPLGLMSFFARATAMALNQFPMLNAQIDINDIVYHEHVNLGIAVSTDRGLVVPILRHAETMSFAKIEQEIKRLAAAARDGKLSIGDLSGGTFTITNGGVFGSLLSTPILNPPQMGILGMHAIQDRPVAVNRHVEVRPMMYVALTYDHRLVDGQYAVSFLVRLKQLLEEPMQMVLEI